GKTTLFNLISGIFKPDFGKIYYRGELINRLKSYEIARKGIGRMFQITQPFRRMKVYENMLTAKFDSKKAINLLSFVELDTLKDELAGNLSGGQQRLLEFARMLMLDPQLLLLDEPMAGLNPMMVERLSDRLKELHYKGATIIIVEHDTPFVMNFCKRILVLDQGEKIAEGRPDHIKKNERVVEAYLGE
ncbi:MAG: ABC transporter ATP-binding protein, partial [Thermodesulfobacteriota bacterium]